MQLLPAYILVSFMVLIGIFPVPFLRLLAQPVALLTGVGSSVIFPLKGGVLAALQPISMATWLLIALIGTLYFLRKFILRNRKSAIGTTWGCGYTTPGYKQQYTASSFVRGYVKLFSAALEVEKTEEKPDNIFPGTVKYETHVYDKAEKRLIDPLLNLINRIMGWFVFLNNGKLQLYILYGILFIMTVLGLPWVYSFLESFFELLKTL